MRFCCGIENSVAGTLIAVFNLAEGVKILVSQGLLDGETWKTYIEQVAYLVHRNVVQKGQRSVLRQDDLLTSPPPMISGEDYFGNLLGLENTLVLVGLKAFMFLLLFIGVQQRVGMFLKLWMGLTLLSVLVGLVEISSFVMESLEPSPSSDIQLIFDLIHTFLYIWFLTIVISIHEQLNTGTGPSTNNYSYNNSKSDGNYYDAGKGCDSSQIKC